MSNSRDQGLLPKSCICAFLYFCDLLLFQLRLPRINLNLCVKLQVLLNYDLLPSAISNWRVKIGVCTRGARSAFQPSSCILILIVPIAFTCRRGGFGCNFSCANVFAHRLILVGSMLCKRNWDQDNRTRNHDETTTKP